jgi:hypothetical protein
MQEATKTEGLAMSLSTPESVQKLQTALHDKAKEAPNFRFYALYDKVYRKDVLAFAYECCKANGGAAGVDGQTFEDIEAYGKERWLDELAQELKNRTYQPCFRRARLSPVWHGSVSCSRSSNRTGASRASGSRRKVHGFAHGKLRMPPGDYRHCACSRLHSMTSGQNVPKPGSNNLEPPFEV